MFRASEQAQADAPGLHPSFLDTSGRVVSSAGRRHDGSVA